MPVVLTKKQVEEWLFDDKTVDEILCGEHPALIKKAV